MKLFEVIDFQSPHKNLQSDTQFVYHATNLDNVLDIVRTKKLKPHKPWEFTNQNTWPDGSTENRSYFSKKADLVWVFAPEHGQGVILRVKRDKANFKVEQSTGDVYTTQAIPSGYIEILDKNNNWHSIERVFRNETV